LIALDTNVLVRVVTRDDPEQLAAAVAVMQAERLWVAKTVLLELEWVLRYAYDLDREVIAETFTRLLGLPNLAAEDRRAVVQARSWYAQGMDFADALHLASSPEAESFATFDRDLATAARDLRAAKVQLIRGGPRSTDR
jgi:predicted nucleic-acid-binding protein